MTQTLTTTSADAVASAWFDRFESALAARDADGAAACFAETCFWRDLVAFTWNIATVEERAGVADLVRNTDAGASGFELTEPATYADGCTTAWFAFETSVGRGSGLVRLLDQPSGDPLAWTLLTTLDELKGHEEPRRDRRPKGTDHGVHLDRVTWAERRAGEQAALGDTEQPYVVIIGGGQGGIALGSRLRQLGVPALVVDKQSRPGDQWRNRYKSLCLHDPVWYDHLPYLKFPDNWPVFAPKDKIADWLESYVKVMEIPYWSNAAVTRATWDAGAEQWTVEVLRDGETVTLTPKQLVFATGMSGKANVPSYPGMDVFAGEQHHSSAHPGPEKYAGKRCVVIGSNNSSFDICGALFEHGADVTMVQRSSTHVVRSDTLMDIGLGDLYSERAVAAGVTTEKADMIFASLPYRILHEFQIPVYQAIAEADKDFYERLEASGFWHDWGVDGSGLFMKYLRRGSGYYIDVGAAELIANGSVKLAHGQVDHLTADAVVLADGTELPADLVVYATGYNSMNGWVADLVDGETAARLGKVWGLGSDTPKDPGPWEGEQRNMWKPTPVPSLWMHGGNLHQSRHYSLYLALQLKARYEGIPTPVYALAPSHHPG